LCQYGGARLCRINLTRGSSSPNKNGGQGYLPPAAVVRVSRPHLGQVNWATTNHLRGCNSYQGMKNFSSNSLSPSPPAILTITEYYFRAHSCGSVVAKFLSPATRGTVLSRGHEAVPWPFRARHENLPSPHWVRAPKPFISNGSPTCKRSLNASRTGCQVLRKSHGRYAVALCFRDAQLTRGLIRPWRRNASTKSYQAKGRRHECPIVLTTVS
jgi:hypothetical protein